MNAVEPLPSHAMFQLEHSIDGLKFSSEYAYDPDVIEVILRMVKPGDWVIDAGANIGYFTLIMSMIVGDAGRVLAVEADSGAFKQLEQNLEINKRSNVTALNLLLWQEDYPMSFWPHPVCGSMVRHKDSLPGKQMPARMLDTLVLEPQPAFIKVDCEGADGFILRGAKEMLKRSVRGVVAEFNHALMNALGMPDEDMRRFMLDLGYDCFLLEDKKPPTYLPPDDPVSYVLNGGVTYRNALFSQVDTVAKLWGANGRD